MAQYVDGNFYTSNKYLDETLQPFDSFDDLAVFGNMFNGLTAVVNNGEFPITLQYTDPLEVRKKYYWVIKTLPVFPTYDDLETVSSDIVTKLSTKKNASKAFYVGLEATVQTGETSGDIERYIVTEVTNGVPTWELVNDSIPIFGDDID